jgi:hypothetical protein
MVLVYPDGDPRTGLIDEMIRASSLNIGLSWLSKYIYFVSIPIPGLRIIFGRRNYEPKVFYCYCVFSLTHGFVARIAHGTSQES